MTQRQAISDRRILATASDQMRDLRRRAWTVGDNLNALSDDLITEDAVADAFELYKQADAILTRLQVAVRTIREVHQSKGALTMENKELMDEARGWLADCGSTRDRTDDEVKRTIEKHYLGGWEEFQRNTNGG